MSAVVVADASPLIAFQQIGQLQLLRTMFGELTVPPAVAREILPSVPFAPWIVVGTLGVILAAKRTGHIAEVRPVVDELLRQGFWVAPRLVKQALLAAAEEGPDGSRS